MEETKRTGKNSKLNLVQPDKKFFIENSAKLPVTFEKLRLNEEETPGICSKLFQKDQKKRKSVELTNLLKAEGNLQKDKLSYSDSQLLVTSSHHTSAERDDKPGTSPSIQIPSGFVKLRRKVKVRAHTPPLKRRADKAKTLYLEQPQTAPNKSRPKSNPVFTMRTRNAGNSSSLSETLESKRMRTAFLDFLQSEYSSENLCFWLSCEKFRKLKSEEQRFKEGQTIYSRYISTNSPYQINIDHVTQRQITLAMTCGDDNVPVDVFDHAQNKVYSIMENDSFPRFVDSSFYKEALPSKKTTLESVFFLSPSKHLSKSPKNSNNNNTKHPTATKEEPVGKTNSRYFSFGFKKSNGAKQSKSAESSSAEFSSTGSDDFY